MLASRAVQAPSARRDLENPSRRGKAAQLGADRLVVGRERIAFWHGRRVVLGGPSAVVGDLLIQQLAVGHRRSDGTPRVTAAATVAVARASACPALREPSPANAAVTASGRRRG